MADTDDFRGDDESDDAQAEDCVGAIIAHATDEVARSSTSAPRAAAPRSVQHRVSISIGKPMEPRPEIALALSASRKAPDLRDYVKSQDFWRVPHFFREFQADFEEEEDYISSLPNEPEALHQRVRLLEKGEREMLIQGLRLQFQRATANYLNAPTEARAANLESLEKIKQDIASLSHPYIFIEA